MAELLGKRPYGLQSQNIYYLAPFIENKKKSLIRPLLYTSSQDSILYLYPKVT